MRGTGYVNDSLRVNSDTKPEEIREFVEKRAKNPIVIDEVVIFNFSTHTVDWDALEARVPRLRDDYYIIPHQFGVLWAYMQELLPKRIRRVELLRYSTTEQDYHPHKNFARASSIDRDLQMRKDLAAWCSEQLQAEVMNPDNDTDIHGERRG